MFWRRKTSKKIHQDSQQNLGCDEVATEKWSKTHPIQFQTNHNDCTGWVGRMFANVFPVPIKTCWFSQVFENISNFEKNCFIKCPQVCSKTLIQQGLKRCMPLFSFFMGKSLCVMFGSEQGWQGHDGHPIITMRAKQEQASKHIRIRLPKTGPLHSLSSFQQGRWSIHLGQKQQQANNMLLQTWLFVLGSTREPKWMDGTSKQQTSPLVPIGTVLSLSPWNFNHVYWEWNHFSCCCCLWMEPGALLVLVLSLIRVCLCLASGQRWTGTTMLLHVGPPSRQSILEQTNQQEYTPKIDAQNQQLNEPSSCPCVRHRQTIIEETMNRGRTNQPTHMDMKSNYSGPSQYCVYILAQPPAMGKQCFRQIFVSIQIGCTIPNQLSALFVKCPSKPIAENRWQHCERVHSIQHVKGCILIRKNSAQGCIRNSPIIESLTTESPSLFFICRQGPKRINRAREPVNNQTQLVRACVRSLNRPSNHPFMDSKLLFSLAKQRRHRRRRQQEGEGSLCFSFHRGMEQ